MEHFNEIRNNAKKRLKKKVLKKIAVGALAVTVGAAGRIIYDINTVTANAANNLMIADAVDATEYTEGNPAVETIDTIYDIRSKQPEQIAVGVHDLAVSAISVSCLKISWSAEPNRSYQAKVLTDAPYSENIRFVYKGNGLVYLTGLRENSEYTVEVIPINLKPNEAAIAETITGRTAHVLPLVEYGKEEGWTSCFAYEKASGLTHMPSSGAINGTVTDPITDTGIRRNQYGDYCCAMGLWYGKVGDRFLVELENGIQFTVQICDSKGWGDDADGDGICDGRFHWFGYKNGKCVIEFIYNDGSLPNCVHKAGSYGYWNWGGLNLGSNIEKIQMISNEGNVVNY